MAEAPEVTFLSLFVPKLAEAAKRYEAILGVAPSPGAGAALASHPFAAGTPVVFQLGSVSLALYQCDMRTTHPGDVGIGLTCQPDPKALAGRVGEHGGRVFFGPREVPGDGRELAVFVLPDRHFFEVAGPRSETDGD